MTDPIQVLRDTIARSKSRGLGLFPAAPPDAYDGEEKNALAALAQVEALVEAARESIDIGDEINRCRICWDAWGNHEDDCALAPFKENP